MRRVFTFFVTAVMSLGAHIASAQETAPEAGDDLEVPATPDPSPAPTPGPDSPSTAAPSVPASPAEPPGAAASPAASAAASSNTAAQPKVEASANAPAAVAPSSTGAAKPARDAKRGLRFSGYVQAEYDHNQASESELDPSGEPLNYNRFYVRRARPRVDYDAAFAGVTLELDANNVRTVTVGVRRAEVRIFHRGEREDGPPLVEVSAGILDIPFGHELGESARMRPFLERSVGSVSLFPTEMDAGVRVSGAVSFFRYGVALINGEPLNSSGFPRDPNRAKDVTARFGAEASVTPGLTVSGGTSFAAGKGFHRGQPATKASTTWRDDNQNGVVDAGELIGVPASAASPSSDFERWALGLDFQARLTTPLGKTNLLAEGFLASNYDRGLYVADPVATGIDVREAGLSVSLLQQGVLRHGLIGFRYAHYDPNSDLLQQQRGELQPSSASIHTFSPLIGVEVTGLVRFVAEYDFVRDHLALDERGEPTDAKNDQLGLRLQGEF